MKDVPERKAEGTSSREYRLLFRFLPYNEHCLMAECVNGFYPINRPKSIKSSRLTSNPRQTT